jgi:hypothetical protein
VDDCGHLENSKWGEEHRLFYVFIKDITNSITPIQKEHQPYYVFIKDITDTMIEMRKEKLINSNQFYENG